MQGEAGLVSKVHEWILLIRTTALPRFVSLTPIHKLNEKDKREAENTN